MMFPGTCNSVVVVTPDGLMELNVDGRLCSAYRLPVPFDEVSRAHSVAQHRDPPVEGYPLFADQLIRFPS